MKKPLKLNLGCGANKLPGYVNIDGEASLKPDLVLNILEKLPYKPNTVDEVVMFHCVEHVSKFFHMKLFSEIWRVLKPEAALIVSYPEFLKCVENWRTNHRGKKDFWEATIYGRQAYPGDFHVTIMHTPDFIKELESWGFEDVIYSPERFENHNTIVQCKKGKRPLAYEELIKQDMENFKLKRMSV